MIDLFTEHSIDVQQLSKNHFYILEISYSRLFEKSRIGCTPIVVKHKMIVKVYTVFIEGTLILHPYTLETYIWLY